MINLLLREEIYTTVSASDFSPAQLESYFNEHKDEFIVAEKVQVKRIFLRVDGNRSIESAMFLAADLRSQLTVQPDRFKELAVEHSDGPYKRRGGDLGYLSREGKPGIDPEVVAKAFDLDVGGISEPFQAADGVNLIAVASKRDRVERTFDQMKGSVLRKLKNERYKEMTDSYIADIKQKYDVKIDEAVLDGIDLEAARRSRTVVGADGEERLPELEKPLSLGAPGMDRPQMPERIPVPINAPD